jgi:hypothetical protein
VQNYISVRETGRFDPRQLRAQGRSGLQPLTLAASTPASLMVSIYVIPPSVAMGIGQGLGGTAHTQWATQWRRFAAECCHAKSRSDALAELDARALYTQKCALAAAAALCICIIHIAYTFSLNRAPIMAVWRHSVNNIILDLWKLHREWLTSGNRAARGLCTISHSHCVK